MHKIFDRVPLPLSDTVILHIDEVHDACLMIDDEC